MNRFRLWRWSAVILTTLGAGVVAGGQAPQPPQEAPPVAAAGPAQGQGRAGGAGAPLPPGYRPTSTLNGVQIEIPGLQDEIAMRDALPATALARPRQPRRVLVLARAKGYAHSSIPLAAATIKALGEKTGAWSTTITFNAADISEENLRQYDAVFLASTTGAFLDEPADPMAEIPRRQALLDFVRSRKGLAGIHAATDSYRGGGGRGRGTAASPAASGGAAIAPAAGPGPWTEWPKVIGGSFKFHWNFPQVVTVKIDDPRSPLTAMFTEPFQVHDEIYTFSMESFSRTNVRVLTSVDYSKMSPEDKAKEPAATRRSDGDYALSYIRREGKGRVFYETLGHSEHIYAQPKMLQHILAGMQYALGDLAADDSPSVK